MEQLRASGALRGEEPRARRVVRALDRNPAQIERTVGINANEVENSQAYLDAGATHLIVMTGHPFDLDPVRRLLDIARS